MVSHWILSENKSLQISRTLLSILAVFSNAVAGIVPARLVISKSSSTCTNHLVTVPRAPITIGVIVTFMFHSFFNSLAMSRYLSLFLHSFNFTLWSARTANPQFCKTFFLLIIKRSGRLAEILWSVCMLKSKRSLCVSFSRTDSGLCLYQFCMVKLQLLAQFPMEHFAHPVVPNLIFF